MYFLLSYHSNHTSQSVEVVSEYSLSTKIRIFLYQVSVLIWVYKYGNMCHQIISFEAMLIHSSDIITVILLFPWRDQHIQLSLWCPGGNINTCICSWMLSCILPLCFSFVINVYLFFYLYNKCLDKYEIHCLGTKSINIKIGIIQAFRVQIGEIPAYIRLGYILL